MADASLDTDDGWGFAVTYTEGMPTGFTAKKNNTDCTGEVTDTGSGLKFRLKANETIHIEFDADASFRFEVTEDDTSNLTDIPATDSGPPTAWHKHPSRLIKLSRKNIFGNLQGGG